jgi:hypothetical protein
MCRFPQKNTDWYNLVMREVKKVRGRDRSLINFSSKLSLNTYLKQNIFLQKAYKKILLSSIYTLKTVILNTNKGI